ncbi:APC family permease [Paenibacillus sp. 481]|uniref:APC family permease n=1 Tax=Paenibacillus sp. 481 TaxID=2835869 RepID=UPI001E37CAD9|nr:amino acid permease [Paenibacillus sp. 481]UHA71769.1 amino acid permease [Paenibacillus sp. 481]
MNPNKPSISVWQGIALYVGAVVGSGILILPGITAGIAGANALIAWIGMILLSIPLAFTFAFLARTYPSAGGVATFVEKAFGTYAGAVIGWYYFIAAAVGQMIVPLTGGLSVMYALDLPLEAAYIIAGGTVLIAGLSNYVGLNISGKVQLAISGLTMCILLLTIVLAVPLIEPDNFEMQLSGSALSSIGVAGMLIFWSFFGWEAISSLAPEFKHPERDLVRATLGALIIVGVLYFGAAVAVIGTQAYTAGSGAEQEAANSASFIQVMVKTTGVHGGYATAVVALLICIGTTNAYVAGISRLGYSLAQSKVAPSWLDYRHGKYLTPTRAVVFVGAVALLGLVITYIFKVGLNTLIHIPNSLGIATYVLGAMAGAKLLRARFEKWMAAVTSTICLLAYPFVGAFIQIPIVVGVCCVAYVFWRKNRP